MSDLSDLALSLAKEMQPKLISAVETARDARSQCPSGTSIDDPMTLHEHLLMTRSQIERIEHLTAEIGLIRGRVQGAVQDTKGAYDDAYMTAATSNDVGFADYASAKEKDANYDLRALREKIEMRKAERLYRDVDNAWQYCRTMLRGAEGVHRDLEVRIRLITLAGQLDK